MGVVTVAVVVRFYSPDSTTILRDMRTLVSGKRIFAVMKIYAVDRCCINIENIWFILYNQMSSLML